MKFLKYLLIIVVVIVALILIIGLIAPKKYDVNRSVTVDAPKSLIMKQVKSLKNMNKWSPWAEYDTNITYVYKGTDGEVGSSVKWEGNEDVGKGEQKITKITDDRVETRVEFIEPWESVSTGYFQFDDVEEGVQVTWGFRGKTPYPWNVMTLFMDMDAAIGKDFEKGLQNLKERCHKLVEKGGSEQYRGYNIRKVDFSGRTFFAKKDTVSFSNISTFYGEYFPAISKASASAGYTPSGPPCGIYFAWHEEDSQAVMAAGIPVNVDDKEAKLEKFKRIDVPAGKALKIAYKGAYEKSGQAHYAMEDYMKEHDEKLNKYVLEEYVTDPSKEPDTSKWLTNIYYLLK